MSPLPVEQLNPDSPEGTIREAISQSIALCMKEGGEQKQCAAIAYQQAREVTGKELMEGKIR
jgi:hypothetical protein